ncbi:acyl-CoA N-acyltransferase [Aspergillus heterothallicus]
MPFTIHPVTLDDTEPNFIVAEKAFHAHNRLLYTGLLSPASRTIIINDRKSSWPPPANVKDFKVVNDAGELIASSRWEIHETDEDLTQSIADTVAARLKHDIPEMRKDLARELYTIFAEARREVLGIRDPESGEVTRLQRRVELVGLFVHPQYQRRGIAARLLRWGIEEAERLGLPLYLEATEEGRPVYERFGFETRKVMPFYGGEYGVDVRVEYAVRIW